MRIAAYDSNTDNSPVSVDVTWPELVEMLTDFDRKPCGTACKGKNCAYKYGPAWSPVDIDGPRASANVRSITCAAFDLDHLAPEALTKVAASLSGRSAVLVSTHTPNCYRLVMPLSRPVPAKEWPKFFRAAINALGLAGLADEACKDLSRLYFTPSIPEGRTPYITRTDGADLDVDVIIAGANASANIPPETEAEDDEPAPTDLNAIADELAGKRRRLASATVPEKQADAALLGRILHHEALALPGARDVTINAAASKLVWWSQGASVDALVELVRPSIGAMECEPEGIAHWVEQFRDCAQRSFERRKVADAERAERDARLNNALLRRLSAGVTQRMVEAGVPAPIEPDDIEPDWKTLLLQTEKGPKSCGENIFRILTHHPHTRSAFRQNALTKEVEVHGGPFATVHPESLALVIMNWLQREFHITAGERDVYAQIGAIARANSYDPIRDYLRTIRWDGVSRIGVWLETYCGARLVDDRQRDITEHVRRIGRKWLIAAVARALRPGCQVDNVLILEGEQGSGKTSALRALGGAWYTGTELVLGDKDTRMQLVKNWIVELAELASFKRSEVESQKAFITTTVDEYRAPYARSMEKHPRRCIFAGTVNPDGTGYLADRTGNRRYWIVACERFDAERIARDRDQLWAEAVVALDAGEQWWLTSDEQKEADTQASARETHDSTEDKIRAWWYGLRAPRPEHVLTHDVAERIGVNAERSHEPRITTSIGIALGRLGFERRRVSMNGAQVRVYVPTEAMRNAPQNGGPNPLRLVAQAKTEKKSGQGETG